MPNRPNLLLITTDQQRFDALNVAGNSAILTPHLNWLADSGIRFRRGYSDAPICVAARATLLTGMYFRNMRGHGNWGQPTAPDAAATLPGLLTRHGYQTRSVGKLHYDPPRCHYGFEHTEILEDYYRHMRRFPDRGIPMDHGVAQNDVEPAISTVDEPWSLTRWIVDRAVDFIETRDPTRPFFLNVGFSKPHGPYDPCLNYWQLYQGMDIPPPVRGGWSDAACGALAGFRIPTWAGGAGHLDEPIVRQSRRAYYACITQIDYNLGHLFSRLRETQLLDNTLILFTSDHGDMLGDHRMSGKTTFFEGSAHVPLLLRGPEHLVPKAQRGTVRDELVCLADVMPTFLNAANVPPEHQPRYDGLDLARLLSGAEPARPHWVGAYSDYFCIIEGPWKYHYCHVGGAELLFNLENDPAECHNLIGLPQHAQQQERLRRRLIEILQKSDHPAVRDGQFVNVKPAPTEELRREIQANRWPGFHSRDHTATDVLH